MFSYDTDELVDNVNKAVDSYREKGYDIIYIKYILPNIMWGVGFSIKGTEGAELYSGLSIVSDLCYEKSRSNAYTAKAFRKYMEMREYKEGVIYDIFEQF